MSGDPLTLDVSKRICAHMNTDHGEALIAYAIHYGGCDSPTNVAMKSINQEHMELEVDGEIVKIPFPHSLANSEDVHKTLVAMNNGLRKYS